MIKILIVDDSAIKVDLIQDIIKRAITHGDFHISIATCSNEARALISLNVYDILIIDIVLPRLADGELIADEGITLLNDILEKKHKYNMPLCIIGTSAHEGPASAAQEIFINRVHQFIPYTNNDDEFSSILYRRISEFFSAFSQKANNLDGFCVVGVVCALDEEIRALTQNGWEWGFFYDEFHRKIYVAEIDAKLSKIKVIAIKSARMGILHASISSFILMNKYAPKYLAMTGIAAAINQSYKLGDVLIPNTVWDWSVGKWKSSDERAEFFAEPYQSNVGLQLANKLEDFASNSKIFNDIYSQWPGEAPSHILSAHIGPFASGPSVVSSEDIREQITKQHRKVIGLDMESYALFEVASYCTIRHTEAFVMKSVVDYADSSKDDRFHKYACYTSSAAFRYFVENYID